MSAERVSEGAVELRQDRANLVKLRLYTSNKVWMQADAIAEAFLCCAGKHE